MGCLDHLFNYIIISYIFGLIFTFESCWSFYCTCSDVRSRQYLHLTCLFSALLHISPYNLVLGWSLSPVFFLHQLTKCIFFSSTISANNMGAVKLYIAAVISACLVVTLLHPVQLQLFIFNAQVELFRVRSLAIQISSILFIRVALPPPVYRFNWGGIAYTTYSFSTPANMTTPQWGLIAKDYILIFTSSCMATKKDFHSLLRMIFHRPSAIKWFNIQSKVPNFENIRTSSKCSCAFYTSSVSHQKDLLLYCGKSGTTWRQEVTNHVQEWENGLMANKNDIVSVQLVR